MLQRSLGYTGINISALCFGTLTIGPLHKNFNLVDGADLFCYACELGVNFFDTADLYETYDYLRLTIKKHPGIVISSRSYAVSAAEMERSIDKARIKLNRDYIDIFSLHEVENSTSFHGHQGALEYLYRAKSMGLIKAVGISTHTVAGVRAGATEPGIDVIHPLINRYGIGIKDGSVTDMIAALQTAREFGKGIYAMKVLAGGHLSGEPVAAIQFVNNLGFIDSLAIGMQSVEEVALNVNLVNEALVPEKSISAVTGAERKLQVAPWCLRCGKCIEKCSFGALSFGPDSKLVVAEEKCLRCGYCARVCPEFCLKII